MTEDNLTVYDQRTETMVADPMWAPTVYAGRVIPDGRCIRLTAMAFDKVRLTISESLESCGYIDGW
jgi:hypothetical protein